MKGEIMKKTLFFCFLIFSFLIFAGNFQIYPNSKLDEKVTKEAMELAREQGISNLNYSIYISEDSFDRVCAFYKDISKEYNMPRSSGTSGKPKKYEKYDLYEAYFIFDRAKDLASSKLWVKVQRPYIGEEILNKTAIIISEKK